MPPSAWSFEITYWGATGSFPRVMSTDEILAKLVGTIRRLGELGKLHDVYADDLTDREIADQVAKWVPFDLRSTYGGNTTCIEIQTPESLLIVDAGSGLQPLSATNQQRWNAENYCGPREGHVLMTHAHLDHTYRLAFADAFYDPRNHFTIWAEVAVVETLNELLRAHDRTPNLLIPINWQHLSGVRRPQANSLMRPISN